MEVNGRPEELDSTNIYRPDTADGSITFYDSDVSISTRCPHCGSIGVFEAIHRVSTHFKGLRNQSVKRGVGVTQAVRQCPNPHCNGLIWTLRYADSELVIHPPQLLPFDETDIPEGLSSILREAIACHSVSAFTAAAIMVRRLLEEICRDAGANGHNLHTRLKDLRNKVVLSEELFGAMDELKVLGNDAAHVEARHYQNVDREEVELSIELAQEILKARFQHKSLIERLKARKIDKNT